MRRPCSSGSCASSSTYSMPPSGICACGELIVYLTSHTPENPGRHFWRCRNFKTPRDCGFFLWDEDAGVQSSGTQRVVDMLRTELEDSKDKLDELKKKLEDTKMKFEDTKMKLEESKNKISKLQRKLDCELLNKKMAFAAILIVVLAWVVSFCFLYGRKM
ncbi:uncharacterized protein At4g04775-like [Lotus japonicus]|uniref:uncharacterized protein At4g04775-like n=1 Tax=Lotus japonicus TaxID=34305 RepID=UPI002583168D|nr:uncharacterized protein At4g04775-like [Lotus japonicus]XP_057433222.1 uncharacterized protein At4g04775-like [Lotus japonicus]XP_057437846.1 uncharacterized protein At4g04775-like [Lotus japonicus]